MSGVNGDNLFIAWCKLSSNTGRTWVSISNPCLNSIISIKGAELLKPAMGHQLHPNGF